MKPVVSQQFERLLLLARTTEEGRQSSALLHVLCAVRRLHDGPGEGATRASLARDLRLHPDYLGRIFKEHTGMEIREYQNRLRVFRAAEYLEKSGEKVITVSGMAGFESLRTFNRAFGRVMRMRPAEYRKLMREGDDEGNVPDVCK